MARGDDVRRERVTCPKRDGGCGGTFWRDKGSKRRKCETCSPPRVSSRAAADGGAVGAVLSLQNEAGGPGVPGSGVAAPGGGTQRVVGPVEAATFARLRARKREGTPEGQTALLLAREMESRVHSGSQLAAMALAMDRLMARAVDGAPQEQDALDELTARRVRRAGGHRT